MAKSEAPQNKFDRIPSEIQEKIDKYDNDIKKLLQQSEYLGDLGKIDEFERVGVELEELKNAKQELIKLAENPTMIAKQQRVCDICGAQQAMNDTERRNQTHLEGKLHIGFKNLREELKNLKKRKEVLKLQAKAQRAMKREEYHRREHEPNDKKDSGKEGFGPVSSSQRRGEERRRDDDRKESKRKRSRDHKERDRSRHDSKDREKKKHKKKEHKRSSS